MTPLLSGQFCFHQIWHKFLNSVHEKHGFWFYTALISGSEETCNIYYRLLTNIPEAQACNMILGYEKLLWRKTQSTPPHGQPCNLSRRVTILQLDSGFSCYWIRLLSSQCLNIMPMSHLRYEPWLSRRGGALLRFLRWSASTWKSWLLWPKLWGQGSTWRFQLNCTGRPQDYPQDGAWRAWLWIVWFPDWHECSQVGRGITIAGR